METHKPTQTALSPPMLPRPGIDTVAAYPQRDMS